ncbi:MAG TPA: 3-hydroxyacyl-CoA dehydrogenase NAD-binding domain-containing protein [Xanthobacteraceae bacterium]|nr:3-hydroxyacyl-CoA dehydrogenase NAD-binding domain-containing protein [Xanthobacteraceae bacterium]
MSDPVSLHHEKDIALVLVDNPPVNALRHAVRLGILEAMRAAAGDAGIRAIVLSAKGRTFMAGADISEFGKPLASPSLPEVIAFMETVQKPLVAAVFGTPLGGGLEITFGCHFRVAAPSTRLGLPEIKLGIIPGAGGTQLLPRLVGVEKAAKMILSGEPIAAADALASGLVDKIVEGDVVQGAVAFAHRVLAEKRALVHPRARDEKISPAARDGLEKVAAETLKKTRGMQAPQAAVESLRNIFTLPVDAGRKRERELFNELVIGEQAAAQRHIFFAEREALKIFGVGKDVKPREIKSAAVIGAGTMGGGIAMALASSGIPVTVIETGENALVRGLGAVRKNFEMSVKRGSLTPEAVEKRLGLVKGATSLDAAKDADLLIEAVFEDMAVKEQVFGTLDKIAKPGAVLATNTSYLDVDKIAAITSRPTDVVGMHFFSPANVMRLLEIVRGEKTSPEVLATALAVGRKLGKTPVVVGVCRGFVGNRMLARRQEAAERLLLDGALPHEVDQALTDFGFPMGPLAVSDLAGLDISWRNRKALGTRAEIADTLCEMGRFGQKTGRGYYRYEPGSRTPLRDPEADAVVVAASQKLGRTRRNFMPDEIVERLIFPMINEGARILEEGIAARASDIDVIWVRGYGFPVWRGGPMFYADSVGLANIRGRLKTFAQESGDETLNPAPLIEKLAATGKGFASS